MYEEESHLPRNSKNLPLLGTLANPNPTISMFVRPHQSQPQFQFDILVYIHGFNLPHNVCGGYNK